MSTISVGERVFEIPDCAEGGDHEPLLRQTVEGIINDGRVLSSDVPCGRCDLYVIAERHPNTGVVSASLEKVPTGGFAGQ